MVKNALWCWLCRGLLGVLLAGLECCGNDDAKRLYHDLLIQNKYNKLIRPVGNNTDKPLTVKMGIRLSQIIDVDRRKWERPGRDADGEREQYIHEVYPNKFVQLNEKRFRIFNTLYELPIMYILVVLVDLFTNLPEYTRMLEGVKYGDLTMTYNSIYQDVLYATERVHKPKGPLKAETIKNVDKYVIKDERLPILLDRMRSSGAKVFMVTNSDYSYTNVIMNYLMDFPLEEGSEKRDWVSYFDYVIVDAKKPIFFASGTILRRVNRETGALKLGTHTGQIQTGHIYSGGSVDIFTTMIGRYDKSVLYFGDHIFGDILKSKKLKGWRTFLVVPELEQELMVWTEKKKLFEQLEDYDHQIGDLYRNMDSSSGAKPDISKIQTSIRSVTHKMDMSYGIVGSLFRSGSRQTFFAYQVQRYADLYAASFLNLLHYPFSYVFRAPAMLMPHESTVGHEDVLPINDLYISRSRTNTEVESQMSPTLHQRPPLDRSESVRLYAEIPRQFTQIQDDSSEDSDSKEKSQARGLSPPDEYGEVFAERIHADETSVIDNEPGLGSV